MVLPDFVRRGERADVFGEPCLPHQGCARAPSETFLQEKEGGEGGYVLCIAGKGCYSVHDRFCHFALLYVDQDEKGAYSGITTVYFLPCYRVAWPTHCFDEPRAAQECVSYACNLFFSAAAASCS